MGNPPFEDVSPIKDGGFPIAMLVYQRVVSGRVTFCWIGNQPVLLKPVRNGEQNEKTRNNKTSRGLKSLGNTGRREQTQARYFPVGWLQNTTVFILAKATFSGSSKLFWGKTNHELFFESWSVQDSKIFLLRPIGFLITKKIREGWLNLKQRNSKMIIHVIFLVVSTTFWVRNIGEKVHPISRTYFLGGLKPPTRWSF